MYLAGEQALADAEAAAARSLERWPPVKREWRDSCLRHHPGWEFKLWNLTAMEQLLRERYPWFLPTFLAYPQPIHRGTPRSCCVQCMICHSPLGELG